MEIKVNYFGPLKDITGKREEKIELDENATIYNLIQRLGEKYGEPVLKLILGPKGDLKNDIQLVINGRSIKSHREIYGSLLTEGAIAAILSVIGGG